MGSGQIDMGQPLVLINIELWQCSSTRCRRLQLFQTPICQLSGFALTPAWLEKANC